MSETEKASIDQTEVRDEKVGLDTVNSEEGDEALRLVGTVRTAQFSEEYNLKLRRKLVSANLA
jgi:ACS family allantoate permease-like MFS transporter